MKPSDRAIDLIKEFEGFRSHAYQDPVGIWTIGFGTTDGVKPGDTCTPEEAGEWLRRDAYHCSAAISVLVRVPITQNQFDALTSWVYNLGANRFAGSSLLRKLNQLDYVGAQHEFSRWVFAAGIMLPGLERRRAAEAKLFGTPDFSNVTSGSDTTAPRDVA